MKITVKQSYDVQKYITRKTRQLQCEAKVRDVSLHSRHLERLRAACKHTAHKRLAEAKASCSRSLNVSDLFTLEYGHMVRDLYNDPGYKAPFLGDLPRDNWTGGTFTLGPGGLKL